MSETLDTPRANRSEQGSDEAAELPFSIILELNVQDPDTIAELCAYQDGTPRQQFATAALRIGVLALKQARGQLDGDVIRRESERLLSDLDHRLAEHSRHVHQRVTDCLKEYFDPESGRFQERIHRLIKQDGELEQLLRRQVGQQDSELCKTLTAHFGDESALMKVLNPDESQGLLAAMRATLAEQLLEQREHVLKQFSLDYKDGALSRLMRELTLNHGKLNEALTNKIDEVVREFSLDEEESALSRLVRNVDRAQKTITREFSLDDEQSALSRLKQMLQTTNEAIHSQLTLDDEKSALSRLRRELFEVLERHGKKNLEFQEEVKTALGKMSARREESRRSTRHGIEFQDAVYEFLLHGCQRAGDVAENTGNNTGRIKNCKVGDAVIHLGPESAAPDARIVVEAKEDSAYTLQKAREEIETACKNRDAQVGLFVFSASSAPESWEPLARYGNDVFVVWNAEDEQTDLVLWAALTLARALCIRRDGERQADSADFTAIAEAILEIEKQTTKLGDITTWTESIQKSSDKILDQIRKSRKKLTAQVELLQEKLEALRGSTDGQETT